MLAKTYLLSLLDDVLSGMGLSWPEKANVEPPKDKRFGDLASNVCMMLAGKAGRKPRELAEDVRAAVLEKGAELQAVDIAGPGFLNFTFAPSFWQQTVCRVYDLKDKYGAIDVGRGRKVQIEYVSANPTGPLHIGHGRGAAVGDSVTRILRFTGHDVETEYYINDAGRQMLILGTSTWVRLQQDQGKDVALPEDCYKGDYILDLARECLEHYGEELLSKDEDEAISLCGQYAGQAILQGIKSDLELFNAEHQVWFSEKSLVDNGDVENSLEFLRTKGLAYDKDGALWFKSTDFGDDKDRVLRKSDGSLTYFASDIAYHHNKYLRGYDLLVDVWGADHHGYIPRMSAAVQALGKETSQFDVILVQLVNLLRDGTPVAMSTRAGEFETLTDVCNEVGADAARFIFLSRKSDSPLDFDLELVKQKSMDNPVYYVQYAHARICSMMRKAEDEGVQWADTPCAPELLARLETEEDMNLLKMLDRFPDVLEGAALHLSPHFLSFYLQELAGALHRYYTVNPVLVAPEPELVKARLVLMSATAQVLRNGLGLLGVSAPEKM